MMLPDGLLSSSSLFYVFGNAYRDGPASNPVSTLSSCHCRPSRTDFSVPVFLRILGKAKTKKQYVATKSTSPPFGQLGVGQRIPQHRQRSSTQTNPLCYTRRVRKLDAAACMYIIATSVQRCAAEPITVRRFLLVTYKKRLGSFVCIPLDLLF